MARAYVGPDDPARQAERASGDVSDRGIAAAAGIAPTPGWSETTESSPAAAWQRVVIGVEHVAGIRRLER
jgi:hypothetical protein